MKLKEHAAVVFLALVIVLACVVPAGAQSRETGFLNRSVIVDGSEYRYQVYVPREFQSTTKWPVILSLHGGGEYGSDGIRQTSIGLASVIRRFPERVPAIVVFPQAHADGKPGWHGAGGRAALAALDSAIVEFSGDRSRIYLTGYSAGGNGSWYLASQHPERFAAVVVVCGFASEFRGTTTGILYPSLATTTHADPFAAVAHRVARLPVWMFHGDADKIVPVTESRGMFSALEAAGANVQYTELPGVAHDAWNPAYDRADLLVWLLKQRKP